MRGGVFFRRLDAALTNSGYGSPSELHTSEAIENRYRTLFLKWAEADKSMKYAARTRYGDNKTFRIGAVVEHVKMTFFPDE